MIRLMKVEHEFSIFYFSVTWIFHHLVDDLIIRIERTGCRMIIVCWGSVMIERDDTADSVTDDDDDVGPDPCSGVGWWCFEEYLVISILGITVTWQLKTQHHLSWLQHQVCQSIFLQWSAGEAGAALFCVIITDTNTSPLLIHHFLFNLADWDWRLSWGDNDNVVETIINNSVNSGVDWFIRWFEGKSHVSIIFWTIFNILKSLHIILIRLLIILMLPLDGSRDVFNELYLDTWLYYYVDIVYEGYFSLWSIWILSFKYSPSQPLLKQWKLKSIRMCLTGWQETKLVISVSLLWRQCASLSKALIAVECQQFLIISKLSTLRQTFSTIFLDLCHQPVSPTWQSSILIRIWLQQTSVFNNGSEKLQNHHIKLFPVWNNSENYKFYIF